MQILLNVHKKQLQFTIRALRALWKCRYSTHAFIRVIIVTNARRIAFCCFFCVNNGQIRRFVVECL